MDAKKNIVICYDGTGNEYGTNNTNVVGTFEAMVREPRQIGFYDPGVGTFSAFGRTLGRRIGIWAGKAFGIGLEQNIEDGYRYLMDHYAEGDEVFLFGFSRGAFTARALAGMLCKVGLLERGSLNLVPYATRLYLARDNEQTVEGFRRVYGYPCVPRFVGVWDTVASLGFVRGKSFTSNRLHPSIPFGRQAVAIHEGRRKFPVSLWAEDDLPEGQSIEQVWFAGVHSDVGGWYDERGLSDTALIWLLKHARHAGLRLRAEWLDRLEPCARQERHESWEGFWKIWPRVERAIPEGALIHSSVLDWMAEWEPDRPLPEGHRIVDDPADPAETGGPERGEDPGHDPSGTGTGAPERDKR